MPRSLYSVPLMIVIVGWIILGAIFIFLRKSSRDKTRTSDRSSFVTIFLQSIGFAVAWLVSRPQFTPFLPVDWHAQYLIAAIIIVFVVSSIWFMSAAVRRLGKQWSLKARVLETHELIRTGPYAIVRHPIYTGMFGMLLAACLANGNWIGLLLSSALYLAGTIARIGIEERLLREQFGAAYDQYAREVPAFIPGLHRFRPFPGRGD